MIERLDNTIENVIKTSIEEIPTCDCEELLDNFLGLFRMRLQPPYYLEIYDRIRGITEVIQNYYPRTAKNLVQLIDDFENNEEKGFELIRNYGIDVTAESTEEEKKILNESDLSFQIICDFFHLKKN